jgi:hypothetical protein
MGYVRILLPVTLAGVALAACKGGSRDQGTETAAVDSTARAADSAAHAAASGPQRIANLMIGKRLGPQNRIAEPTFQFQPQDTVYVSMGLEGAGRRANSPRVGWPRPVRQSIRRPSRLRPVIPRTRSSTSRSRRGGSRETIS